MSLYKRGNIWWVRIQVGGKRYYYSSKTDDRKIALEFERQIKRDVALDRIGNKVHTLDEVAIEWAKTIAPRQKDGKKSLQNLKLIADYIDGIPIKDAPSAASRIKNAYHHLTPATVNRRLALVRRFCNLAAQWGWVESAPKIELLSGEKPRNIYLTKLQVVRLAKASGNSKWHILTLAFTGMRIGELLRSQEKDGMLYVDDTKNGRPRAIPLNKAAQSFYKRLNHDRVYLTIQRDFKRATEACGLSGVRLHDLRHTNASWLVKKGVNLATIRDILGHSSLSVTSRYTHLNVDQMREALDKI